MGKSQQDLEEKFEMRVSGEISGDNLDFWGGDRWGEGWMGEILTWKLRRGIDGRADGDGGCEDGKWEFLMDE